MTCRAEPPVEPGTYSEQLARHYEATGEHFCRCSVPCNASDHTSRVYRCPTCKKCAA